MRWTVIIHKRQIKNNKKPSKNRVHSLEADFAWAMQTVSSKMSIVTFKSVLTAPLLLSYDDVFKLLNKMDDCD